MTVRIRDARVRDLTPEQVYRILALRIDEFVVEQQCAYADADGRDLEPGSRWVWATDGDQTVGTLRILRDGETFRVGRVATARSHRGRGIAGDLMVHALRLCDGEVVLDAQTYLRRWYAGFGFEQRGEEFVEDGIPHVPMRLTGP